MKLEPDPFLNELNKLFVKTKAKGSVFITLKRSNMVPKRARRGATEQSESEYRCLVRATDGKRKISTEVNAKDVNRFRDAYATILRAHTDSLKRREKTKRQKTADI